jgi:NADH-quinone oxidoreductase subunit H
MSGINWAFWGHAVVALGVTLFLLQVVPIMVWIERKVCARIQNRRGPNRVGPFGLLQPVADAVKLICKEEVIPERAERALYYLAPFMAFVPAALAFAVIPVGKPLRLGDGTLLPLAVADIDVGILFVLAISSIGVYAMAFAGWSANSKYSLLGGIRAASQTISYEVAMGLAIVAVIMTTGTAGSPGSVHMGTIVAEQQGTWLGFIPRWNVFTQPIAALIFLVAAFAENNRLPFDLPEAEPELAAGYHTEYSGLKFAMFMLGEYVAMIGMSAVMVTLFLGGWGLPGLTDGEGAVPVLLSIAIFVTKVFVLLFFYVWVRWTLPRFRYDQLMKIGWGALIPLGLANVILTGLLGLM